MLFQKPVAFNDLSGFLFTNFTIVSNCSQHDKVIAEIVIVVKLHMLLHQMNYFDSVKIRQCFYAQLNLKK